ncbi:AMP deaminase isoform A [Micractinium conductrix]|uniref:AMP deaminase n=1 Tax=Micractinium conductrix TaxID=554055 RepID=A0A2P6UZI1_9CHLO|nr:AMP deaminase isoform A [Micractinium conductrix]|eukprot:PSC67241.1 AMP deaminase isoform A [Micractinium conductrix]
MASSVSPPAPAPPSQPGWGSFLGGALLGGTVAAGAAYLAVRYGVASAAAAALDDLRRSGSAGNGSQRRRPTRIGSGARGEGKGLVRAGTDLYYANGVHEGEDAAHAGGGRAAPSPRSAAPAAANGWADGGGRPPRGKPPHSQWQALSPRAPGSARHYPHSQEDHPFSDGAAPPFRGGGAAGRHNEVSESEAAAMSARGDLPATLYPGSADRSNSAIAEYLRNQGTPQFSFPTLLGAAGSPGQAALLSAGAPRYLPPLSLDNRSAQSMAAVGGGAPAGGSAAGAAGAGQQLVVGSYPANITAQPPPAMTTITTADAMASEGRIIEDAAMHEAYVRVITPEPAPTEETEEVSSLLKQSLDMRARWLFRPVLAPEQQADLPEAVTVSALRGSEPFDWQPQEAVPWECEMAGGVMRVWADASREQELWAPPGTSTEFFSDMHWMLKVISLGHVRTFTHHRLLLLEQKFNLHVMLNADKEFLAQKSAPHRDFYNVRKVDTHVHHSACMHQKHLLRFIKSKLKKEPDEVVIFRDGKYLTLREVFESLNLTPYDLNVDTLDVHADKNIFHRFDKFNLKYNPFGQSRLREIFIKQDNLIHGRFLAELTQEVFIDLEASKYQHTEYRISVYGRKPVEWDTLAAWVVQNRLYSDNNIWMIQVPRLYNVYKEQGIIESFEQLLSNIFTPLFEVTADPNSHPQLHLFLQGVSGFDLVDDESKPERRPNKHMPNPRDWTSKHNPAYAYYAYYIYANLHVLNKMREARGLNTFSFRPHAGEAGDIDHLVTSFLLSENIAHGINLRKSPSLQYLYYIAQIGLCMSPLSNNSLFLDYHRNPFPTFFARGLSVSLSTDDPLQIHLTKEPLVEEYSVAAQVWKLSATDLCEVARNSVLHSGFPHQVKMHWVHTDYWKLGPEGNDIQKTNVPALRMRFRKDCHVEETGLLMSGAANHAARLRAKEVYSAAE